MSRPALALAGHRSNVDFRQLDAAHLHPGRSAEILLDGRPAGKIGGLHPRLLKALDLDCDVYVFELDLAILSAGQVPRARALSRFPSLRRDIAVVLPIEVSYAAVEACVRGALDSNWWKSLFSINTWGPISAAAQKVSL